MPLYYNVDKQRTAGIDLNMLAGYQRRLNEAQTLAEYEQILKEMEIAGTPYQRVLEDVSKKQGRRVIDQEAGALAGRVGEAEAADLADYEKYAMQTRAGALGSMAGRGLTQSIASGGSGKGFMTGLGDQMAKGYGGISAGYQDMLNQLERDKYGTLSNLDDYYRALAKQKQAKDSQKAGLADYLGLGIKTVSSFIPGI